MGNVSKTSCKWFQRVGELSQFKEVFRKNYDENSNKGYFLEVNVEYSKNLHNLHNDLPFLPERKKIKNVITLLVTFMTRKLCCSHKGSKTSTKSWINTKKVHRVIQFNQKAWLKP